MPSVEVAATSVPVLVVLAVILFTNRLVIYDVAARNIFAKKLEDVALVFTRLTFERVVIVAFVPIKLVAVAFTKSDPPTPVPFGTISVEESDKVNMVEVDVVARETMLSPLTPDALIITDCPFERLRVVVVEVVATEVIPDPEIEEPPEEDPDDTGIY